MIRTPQPLRDGRWLAWLMHDVSLAEDDVPSARRLICTTRTARSTQVGYQYSEPQPGMIPSLDVSLIRLDVTRRFAPPVTYWRAEAAVTLLAGVQPLRLHECRSFAYEENARSRYEALCELRDQITDPPAGDWANPVPHRPHPIPVGTATAWWYPAEHQDLSDQFWLRVLGLDVEVRRRSDGLYVHVDTSEVDPWHGPLLVEVNNGGPTTYGHDAEDELRDGEDG